VVLDPLAQQVGIGGAVAVILVGTVLKFLPAFMEALRRNGNGNKSGEKPVSFWTQEIAKAVEDGIRKAISGRNEEIRRIIREELNARRK